MARMGCGFKRPDWQSATGREAPMAAVLRTSAPTTWLSVNVARMIVLARASGARR